MSPPRAAPPIRWTRSPPGYLYEISIQAWTTHLLSRLSPLPPQCRHNNFHPTQSLLNESAPIPPSTPLGSSTAKRKSNGRGVATSHTGVSQSRATTSNRRHQHRQHRRSPDDFASTPFQELVQNGISWKNKKSPRRKIYRQVDKCKHQYQKLYQSDHESDQAQAAHSTTQRSLPYTGNPLSPNPQKMMSATWRLCQKR